MTTYTQDEQASGKPADRKRSVRDSAANPELVSATLLEAEAKLVDSGAMGVGGRCLPAYRGTPTQLLLRDLHGRCLDDPLLVTWLPMTFDTDHGSYSTYVGLDYFDHVVQSTQRSADCERVDAYIAAAAIDLALLEARASAASPHGPQLTRTRAATPGPPQPDTSCDIAAPSGR